jgi:hypothetical protein
MPDRRDPTMPGGDQAVEHGCLCPVLDNGHGNVDLARDRGGWVIVSDCPLHGIGGSQPAPIPPQPGSRPLPAHNPHSPASHGKARREQR